MPWLFASCSESPTCATSEAWAAWVNFQYKQTSRADVSERLEALPRGDFLDVGGRVERQGRAARSRTPTC